MNDYKAVPSGLDISRRVADCLEAAAAVGYLPNERTRAIRAVNDILQGRSTRSAEELLVELDKCGEGRIASVRQDIQDFLRQKELLTQVYDKGSGDKQFLYKHRRQNGKSLKVIGQRIYDRAARAGFPPDFFRESYFDNVTFYCLPVLADFFGSELRNCKFAVCRMEYTSFIGAHIYDTEFYSCVMNYLDFFTTVIAHTRFDDCELSHSVFHKAELLHCGFTDCTLDHINFLGALLDGCSFGRITAGTIRNLDKAIISLGGATLEECRQNKESIYQALGVKEKTA